MSAVTLFDLLAAHRAAGPEQLGPIARSLTQMADLLVEAALDEYRRLGEYEQRARHAETTFDANFDLEWTRAVWGLYAQWAGEAEQILSRIRLLNSSQNPISGAGQLEDALARVRARLRVSPESLSRAAEQIRRGQGVPVKELRDELRARRRA
jgi:hypothetical protein